MSAFRDLAHPTEAAAFVDELRAEVNGVGGAEVVWVCGSFLRYSSGDDWAKMGRLDL